MADVKYREEGEGDVTTEKQRVKELFREWGALTEPLTTPIVYHPGGWEDSVPSELKDEVLRQRLEKLKNGGWDEATDAEVLCYLQTASLVQPLGSDWTQIYLYQTSQFMPQVRDAIPDIPKELTEYQKSELNDLKRKIRDSQIRRRKSKRKEKDMAKRKLVMEEHDGSVLIGVMQDGCDPMVKTTEGSLDDALAAVPDFLKEAQEKWTVQPKNPAHKPPAAPKKAPAAAAATPAPAQKAEDLPLLSGTVISKDEAIKIAEEQGGSREELEAQPEAEAEVTEPPAAAEAPPEVETVAEVEAEVTEPPAAPAAVEPEAEPPPVEPVHTLPIEGAPEEEKAEDIATMQEDLSQRIAAAPAPQPAAEAQAAAPPSAPAKPGEWDYYLQDGRGPFENIQLAMDALGLETNTRPQHNRWDRLSTALKEKIQRRPKA